MNFEDLHGQTLLCLRPSPGWSKATISPSGTYVTAEGTVDGQTCWSANWDWQQFILREMASRNTVLLDDLRFEDLHGLTLVDTDPNPAWYQATIDAQGKGVRAVSGYDGCATSWVVTETWKSLIIRLIKEGRVRSLRANEKKRPLTTSGGWNSFG